MASRLLGHSIPRLHAVLATSTLVLDPYRHMARAQDSRKDDVLVLKLVEDAAKGADTLSSTVSINRPSDQVSTPFAEQPRVQYLA